MAVRFARRTMTAVRPSSLGRTNAIRGRRVSTRTIALAAVVTIATRTIGSNAFVVPSMAKHGQRMPGSFGRRTIPTAAVAVCRGTKLFSLSTKPRAAPRFDDFSELLVGSWMIEPTSNPTKEETEPEISTATVAAEITVEDVEEVMRSCGGAVQGIREPATTGGGSTYLNRANDGFVFFEDGCYTMGPVSIRTGGSSGDGRNKDEESSFLSCLVLPKSDPDGRRQRLVIELFGWDSISRNAAVHPSDNASLRTKQRFGDNSHNSSSSSSSAPKIRAAASIPSIGSDTSIAIESIATVARCRMPSEGQPWMLQRAKWETLVGDSEEEGTDPEETPNGCCYWVSIEPVQNFSERFGLPVPSIDDDDAFVVCCGIACPATRTFRVLARRYDPLKESPSEGGDMTFSLREILRIDGSVRFH